MNDVTRAECGTPMVLLHPFGLCTDVWSPVLPHLRCHHEVSALGIPGHVGSESVPTDYDHTIAAAVDLLEKKLDRSGIERAHLVGSSLGGWLAIELARRGRALSVVAFAPGGGWERGSAQERRLCRHFRLTRVLLRVGGSLAVRMVHMETARDYFLRDAVARPRRLSPREARLLIESIWRCEVYDDAVRALARQAPSEPFPTLPCPFRIVWGTHDRLLPLRGYSERWMHVLPGAEWVVLPEVGHIPMYDAPELVAESILEVTTRRGHLRAEPQRAAS
jgi:pimeloyl-ACP methyl ester carboxylesterase